MPFCNRLYRNGGVARVAVPRNLCSGIPNHVPNTVAFWFRSTTVARASMFRDRQTEKPDGQKKRDDRKNGTGPIFAFPLVFSADHACAMAPISGSIPSSPSTLPIRVAGVSGDAAAPIPRSPSAPPSPMIPDPCAAARAISPAESPAGPPTLFAIDDELILPIHLPTGDWKIPLSPRDEDQKKIIDLPDDNFIEL